MEETLLTRYCLTKLDEIVDLVGGLDDATANATPDLPGANSPYQLLRHCLGMLAWWSETGIHGRDIGRHRDSEFTATGPVADLIEYAGQVRAQFRATMAATAPDQPVVGRSGLDEFWSDSVEGILLHVFEELCQHLGHLEITRDLVTAS